MRRITRMSAGSVGVSMLLSLAFAPRATAQTIQLSGEVADEAPDHVRIPFEVPSGIAEVEVAHDDLSEANILDWGLEDPNGFRGWGGGNEEPAVVGELAASRSYLPGPIVAGTWNVVIGKAKIAEAPASYEITVTLRDAPTLAPQTERMPYVPAAPLSNEARWYAGDFHVHSSESGDASASIDEIATLAASRGLDFVVLTEHNTVSHADFIVDAQSRHPTVLLIPGIEVTTYDGHAGAFGATSFVEHKIGLDGATAQNAIDQVHAQNALWSINHPAFDLGDLCIGCAWTHDVDFATVDAVEIATASAPSLLHGATIDFWETGLAQGHHLAALGGSDDHRAGVDLGPLQTPIGTPTTMVYAEALSADAILAGVAAGRTAVKLFGPDDPMIELTTDPPLTPPSDSSARQGDSTAAEQVLVQARITGGAGTTMRWVVNGTPGDATDVDADPFTTELLVTPPATGEMRVRAETLGALPPGVTTLTSHVWLSTGPATPASSPSASPSSSSGCGCHLSPTESRLGWLLVALVLSAAPFRRRRSVSSRARPR